MGSEADRIDLLLTDVVLPGEQGPELAARLQRARPDMPVLYMSGYTAGVLEQRGIEANRLVRKPVSTDELLARVRVAMDG